MWRLGFGARVRQGLHFDVAGLATYAWECYRFLRYGFLMLFSQRVAFALSEDGMVISLMWIVLGLRVRNVFLECAENYQHQLGFLQAEVEPLHCEYIRAVSQLWVSVKTYIVLILPYAVVQTSHSELNAMFSNVFTLFGPVPPRHYWSPGPSPQYETVPFGMVECRRLHHPCNHHLTSPKCIVDVVWYVLICLKGHVTPCDFVGIAFVQPLTRRCLNTRMISLQTTKQSIKLWYACYAFCLLGHL